MHSDLMLAAGFQPDLHTRGLRVSFDDVNVSHCRLTGFFVCCGVDPIRGVLRQVRPNRKILRFHVSVHDGDVPPPGAMILELIL